MRKIERVDLVRADCYNFDGRVNEKLREGYTIRERDQVIMDSDGTTFAILLVKYEDSDGELK